MSRTWIKWMLAAALPLLALSAYAHAYDPYRGMDRASNEDYYEYYLSSCLVRYQESGMREDQLDCFCDRLASHALRYRDVPPGEIPELPRAIIEECRNP